MNATVCEIFSRTPGCDDDRVSRSFGVASFPTADKPALRFIISHAPLSNKDSINTYARVVNIFLRFVEISAFSARSHSRETRIYRTPQAYIALAVNKYLASVSRACRVQRTKKEETFHPLFHNVYSQCANREFIPDFGFLIRAERHHNDSLLSIHAPAAQFMAKPIHGAKREFILDPAFRIPNSELIIILLRPSCPFFPLRAPRPLAVPSRARSRYHSRGMP